MATPRSHQQLLNLLQFVRVVEAGSFAEAARRAGTSTSAMSKAIARFEQMRGVKLLHRTTHAISLTHDGERLLESARDLLRQAEQLDVMLDEATGGEAGRVRLAAPGAFLRACIAPKLPAILKANPALELELKVDDVDLDLGTEGIDIAIRFGSLDRHPGVTAKRLAMFPWVLVATRRYIEFMGEPRSVRDLKAHHQIGFRDPATGQLMPWQFQDPSDGALIRMLPRKRVVVEDMSVAWAMVSRGLGIAWLPAWCGLKDLEGGRIVELLRPWRVPNTPIHAVQVSRKQMPTRIRSLLRVLSDSASTWEYHG